MLRFSHHAVGILQGSEVLFSAFEDDGPMWTGTGPREERKPVRFSEVFDAPPVLHVGLSMWDVGRGTNQRMDVRAENVTAEGCDLVFRSWGDTRVARVRADWLAIGPMPHVDDWEL